MIDFQTDSDYEVCLVTFIDVLGFRGLLKTRSGAEVAKVLRIFRQASRAPDRVSATRSDEHRLCSETSAEIVSDAVVRIRTTQTQYPDASVVYELIDLLHIQIECVANMILVRGAMTIGPMHVAIDLSGPFFGPALVDAYEMEEREVIYPRIAIHESVLERHRLSPDLWSEGHTYEDERITLDHLLDQDDAGLHFIDYLRASLDELDGGFEGWIVFLSRHKHLVEAQLAEEHPASVRRKYVWLRNYHNQVINERLDALSESDSDLYFRPGLESLVIG